MMMMLWIEFRHPRQTHGNAAPLAMFVVWINNNNNIKPTVFVWYSTPPKTIYLGCFLSLLVVLNHKSGVWLTPPKTRHTWPPGTGIVFAFLFVLNHKGCLLYHLGLEREVTDWHRASESDTCELHGFALKCTFRLLNARSLSTQFQFQFLDNFDPFSSFVFTPGDLGPLTEPESEGHWGGQLSKRKLSSDTILPSLSGTILLAKRHQSMRALCDSFQCFINLQRIGDESISSCSGTP